MLSIKQERWIHDFGPVDSECKCKVCQTYSKAYLRHLFIAGEMFAAMIASEHNLAFYLDLVREARRHIAAGDFKAWKEVTVKKIMTRL